MLEPRRRVEQGPSNNGVERTVRCAAPAEAKRHVAALLGGRKDAQV